MRVEVYYETIENERDLEGKDLHCAGYPIRDTLTQAHPLNKGGVVGLEVHYATRDEDMKIFDDKSERPLRGCVYRNGDVCELGGGLCPVAGVVDIKSFRERLSRVKNLEHTTYATG